MLEDTAFGAFYHTSKPGLQKAAVHVEGFTQFGTGVTAIDGRMRANFAIADVPVTVSPDGGDLGEVGYFLKSLMSSYNIGGPIGTLNKFQSDSSASGLGVQLVGGTIMEDGKTARVAGGNTVTQPLGAVGASQKLYACLHLLSFTGTNVTFVVESAATDFGTPTTRMTFTTNTATGSEILAPVSGAITDTFWRVYYTGTFTSFNAVITIGIQ